MVRRTEQLLRESERRYRAIVDQSNPICRYSPDYHLTFVNQAYCELLGQSSEALLGRSILEVLPEEAVAWFKESHSTLHHPDAVSDHEGPVTNNGVVEWQQWTTRPIFDENGSLVEYQGIGSVITARKQAELELIQAKLIAEEANRTKSQFLSNMSHELRTPLNAIIGFSQLLETDTIEPLTPTQLESVELIHRSGHHLLILINDILDLAKVESGKLELSLEAVQLNDLIADCMPLIAGQAEKYHIEIINHAETANYLVRADYVRLKQVIVNLLSNAIKYNRPYGYAEIAAERKEHTVRISISDNGFGIAPEKMADLFKPFARLGPETTAIEGTGIGLSLSKGLVERMNGQIGVNSTLGEGSCFWIELPVSVANSNAYACSNASPTAYRTWETKECSHQLLYIEDNPSNRQLMTLFIKRFPNTQLQCAEDAYRGLELVERIKPDIILMDIDLPGMNGFEALTAIRKRFTFARDTPIIAISANAMKGDVDAGLAHGFHRYLTKPLDFSILSETLHELLQKLQTPEH